MQEKVQILDTPVVVAVSGGVDSMVLLDIVLAKISHKNIFVAHFNHGLRGEESDGDEIFVKNFCEKNNIAFFSEKQDIAQIAKTEKESIEATARKYRYNFFKKIYKKTKALSLLTAHHLDDRIETAMFNLIRGTKFAGLYALRSFENRDIDGDKISIFRPFLQISKSEIMAYATEKNIDFREDSTNIDTTFQRNFLRHEILPKFEKINAEYRKSINNFLEYIENFASSEKLRTIKWLQDQNEKFYKKGENFEKKIGKKIIYIFSISDLRLCDTLLQFSIFEYIYKEKNHGNIGLSGGLLDELLRFSLEGKNSFGVKKVKNLELERRGEFVYILE